MLEVRSVHVQRYFTSGTGQTAGFSDPDVGVWETPSQHLDRFRFTSDKHYSADALHRSGYSRQAKVGIDYTIVYCKILEFGIRHTLDGQTRCPVINPFHDAKILKKTGRVRQ